MKKRHLIIDVAKCINCNNCLLACKDEHSGNDWPGYTASQPLHGHRWIDIRRRERGTFPSIDVAYLPVPCMHCDDAPCIRAAAGTGAVVKREDGIVLIDPEKARGHKHLVDACPYHAIWWNPEADLPQKCTFCAHLLDNGWHAPRCVQACPTGALKAEFKADENSPSSPAEALTREPGVLAPALNSRPRVFYRNLYRYNRCFVSGSVSFARRGVVDCAQGAGISMCKDGQIIQEAVSDHFGDFKFDNLEQNSGKYNLEIRYEKFTPKLMEVKLMKSLHLGEIRFE